MSISHSIPPTSSRGDDRSLHYLDAHGDDASSANSDGSVLLSSQTDVMSPTLVPYRGRTGENMAIFYSYGPDGAISSSNTDPLDLYTPVMYGGVYKQNDPVGQYLAQEAFVRGLETPCSVDHTHHPNLYAGHETHSQRSGSSYDSYTYRSTPFLEAFLQFPDPERIRHLHTLHGLLPHIQPKRKLNALSGPQINIIEGYTDNVFCTAVSKKMLVLFLGREAVSKFLHTIKREDNECWEGFPTQQNLVLPHGVASQAAFKILMSWMIRACKVSTMSTMRQIRIPNNMFAACSLAQTLALLGLHKDAYRVDMVISQHFSKRPIYPVEVETLWNCLGEKSKYVYGCIKSFSEQLPSKKSDIAEELEYLRVKCPLLHARICDPRLNEMHKPEPGRQWFAKVGLRGGGDFQAEDGHYTTSDEGDPTPRRILQHSHNAESHAISTPASQVFSLASQRPQIRLGQEENTHVAGYLQSTARASSTTPMRHAPVPSSSQQMPPPQA
ncbi:hypothetical protein EKO04_000041 [Ascochyta lentis]|uniref:Uncharacterized protein n=1 Tax=Ascochyta lentis TaxID=205686 RepID=A0A8H7MIB6_9PLEO|nr:hypothetical protein EKO04_000041 [Ascochyta lentis]